MKKVLLPMSLLLVIANGASAQSDFYKYTEELTPKIAQIIVDVGDKCGVDAKNQETLWYMSIKNGTPNEDRFKKAQIAQADNKMSEYKAAIQSIVCP
mgnify:CR=1|tara:strand:- start:19019 stop:19309 length:291 start_codon:yes stop_codon:yes gene_type:complete